MTNRNYHHQIHFILERCKPSRIEIAKTLGKSRQTISDWEYKRVKVRDHMVEEIARAANYDLANVPEHIKQRDLDDYLIATANPDPKTPQRPAKRPAKTIRGREVELNYGEPTARNQNPDTFIGVSRKHQSEGREIPSDNDYPDLAAIALKKLPLYEAVFVPPHTIPRVNSETGTISRPAAWFYKSANGQYHRRMTQDDALKHIEELRQSDDVAAQQFI